MDAPATVLPTAKPAFFRLVISLGIAGLISGFALVGVYQWTRPMILRNQAEALERAVYKVLPGTKDIQPLELKGSKLVPYEGDADKAPEGMMVYAGRDADGNLLGYAIPAEGSGFQDVIKILYGYDPARRVVVGMEVLDSKETPGLGDKINADPDFHANFKALEVDPDIVAIKPGKKTSSNQIETISGATISSEALTKILDRSTKRWVPLLCDPAATGER